jgi:hypothetical protein
MERAFQRAPLPNSAVVPVKLQECEMPEEIKRAEPLWVTLTNDRDAAQWDLLMSACGADLGTDAPHWLEARDEIVRHLGRNQSVNLIVKDNPRWREMVMHIQFDLLPELGIVDLDQGSTASRRGLVGEILKAVGVTRPVPPEPEDLIELDRALSARKMSQIAMLHLDNTMRRNYGADLFSALRFLIMESRKLALLAQSRQHFLALVPQDHPLSKIDLKTVELIGHKR